MNTSILFMILGWSLAAAGGARLGWAVGWGGAATRGFRRRVVRLRRCPRCWYDMSAIDGLRCSECGREVKSERKLFKTRRRWRWAIVGLAAVVAGYPVARIPAIRAHGWVAAIPTTALVCFASVDMHPWSNFDPLWRELAERRYAGEVALWQDRILIRRTFSARPRDLQGILRLRDKWPRGAPLYGCIDRGAALICDARHPRVVQVTADIPEGAAVKGWLYGAVLVNLGAARPDDPTQRLGTPAADAASIPCEVSIVEQPTEGGRDRGRLVWKARFSAPVNLVDDVSQILTPVTDLPVERLLSHARGPVIRVEPSSDVAALDLGMTAVQEALGDIEALTIACRIEIMRDGEVVAAREAWWPLKASNRSTFTLQQMSRVWFRDDALVGGLRDRPDGDWSVRLVSDPLLALRIFDIDHYWEGDITLPLTVTPPGGISTAPLP